MIRRDKAIAIIESLGYTVDPKRDEKNVYKVARRDKYVAQFSIHHDGAFRDSRTLNALGGWDENQDSWDALWHYLADGAVA